MEHKDAFRATLVRVFTLSLGIGIIILLIGFGMSYAHIRLADAAEKRYLNCYLAKCGQLDALKTAASGSRKGITSWSLPFEVSGYAAATTSLVNLLALALAARSLKQHRAKTDLA